jgi:aminopeptidase N
MNTWTNQIGYPLITIERIDNQSIKITQTQFLLNSLNLPAKK